MTQKKFSEILDSCKASISLLSVGLTLFIISALFALIADKNPEATITVGVIGVCLGLVITAIALVTYQSLDMELMRDYLGSVSEHFPETKKHQGEV